MQQPLVPAKGCFVFYTHIIPQKFLCVNNITCRKYLNISTRYIINLTNMPIPSFEIGIKVNII